MDSVFIELHFQHKSNLLNSFKSHDSVGFDILMNFLLVASSGAVYNVSLSNLIQPF